MADLADQARSWRKQMEQYAINPGLPEPANPGEVIRTEKLEHGAGEVRIYKEQREFHAGSFRTIKPDEETFVLVGCPTDRGSWQNQECICRATGERGCMELHSITKRG